MKALRYLAAGVLILVALLTAMAAPNMPSYASAPAQPYVMGIVLLVWGVLLIQYQKLSYKGGAATIIGAFLFGIGLAELSGEFLWKHHEATSEVWITAIAETGFIVAGLALLAQGHRIHKAVTKQNEDI